MTRNDKTEPPLPVTAEVGDEGGSFAEATSQAETFSGVFGHPRVDATAAGAAAPTPEPDAQVTPADQVTHATEPSREERSPRGPRRPA